MKTNKNILAVCDLEEAYAYNFVEYINQKRSIPFDVQAFTAADKLMKFCEENHIEILLVSDQVMNDTIQNLDIGKIIILSQGIYNPQLDQYPSVYKYQSSDMVIREVMNCYGIEKMVTAPLQRAKSATEIIGVYSPIGRTSKTSFALTMGQVLARHKIVLYLNLEEYSGFEQLLDCKFERTLGDLIYYIRQGNVNLFYKMSGMIQSINNLDYLPPALSPIDIQSTSYEEWMTLINEIIQKSSYETIILDFGDGVTDLYGLLNECTKIYMPIRGDVMSTSKIAHFENLLEMWNYQETCQKIQKVKLPYHQVQKRGTAYFDELIWSEMGDYVRELTRKDSKREMQEFENGII